MIQTVVKVGLGYPAEPVNEERTVELVAVLAFKSPHNSNQDLEGCSEPEGLIVV